MDQEEYDEALMLVRVALAQHKPAQAVEILARFRAHLDRPENIQTTIAFLALSVVALHQSGRREEAMRCAARLLALTEPEGYIRVYLDAGPLMKQALSQQEQRVLRLLVTGQTYAEMATTLIVSPNTVKTQVSSIYRKLGVSRRAEAIARTSQLHLLSPDP